MASRRDAGCSSPASAAQPAPRVSGIGPRSLAEAANLPGCRSQGPARREPTTPRGRSCPQARRDTPARNQIACALRTAAGIVQSRTHQPRSAFPYRSCSPVTRTSAMRSSSLCCAPPLPPALLSLPPLPPLLPSSMLLNRAVATLPLLSRRVRLAFGSGSERIF